MIDSPERHVTERKRTERHSVKRFFANLGPGLITGAADDDPSGISTYSVTGAAFGYAQLWTAIFSFPLMAAVQLMCARLGLVTGQGLARAIRGRYSRRVLWSACALLVVANVVNIGADLKGMAEAMEMMTGLAGYIWLPLFAVGIVAMLIWSSYRRIVMVFKWLTLVLFAYVIAAFLAHPQWSQVLRATFIPHVEDHTEVLANLARADVHVFPSVREGFGMVVLEAMSVGTPTVTSDHRDNFAQHLITHGHDGLVSDASPSAIAAAVLHAAGQRARLSHGATQTARRYDWEVLTDQAAAAYDLNRTA